MNFNLKFKIYNWVESMWVDSEGPNGSKILFFNKIDIQSDFWF